MRDRDGELNDTLERLEADNAGLRTRVLELEVNDARLRSELALGHHRIAELEARLEKEQARVYELEVKHGTVCPAETEVHELREALDAARAEVERLRPWAPPRREPGESPEAWLLRIEKEEDYSWMSRENAIAHYLCAVANWHTVLDERNVAELGRDAARRELDELRQVKRGERSVRAFAAEILHGDEEHRRWLLDAAERFIRGEPTPPTGLARPGSESGR